MELYFGVNLGIDFVEKIKIELLHFVADCFSYLAARILDSRYIIDHSGGWISDGGQGIWSSDGCGQKIVERGGKVAKFILRRASVV